MDKSYKVPGLESELLRVFVKTAVRKSGLLESDIGPIYNTFILHNYEANMLFTLINLYVLVRSPVNSASTIQWNSTDIIYRTPNEY